MVVAIALRVPGLGCLGRRGGEREQGRVYARGGEGAPDEVGDGGTDGDYGGQEDRGEEVAQEAKGPEGGHSEAFT